MVLQGWESGPLGQLSTRWCLHEQCSVVTGGDDGDIKKGKFNIKGNTPSLIWLPVAEAVLHKM